VTKPISLPSFWHGRRYYAFSRFLLDNFGQRVFKIAIDAGFTCPNRDGRVGTGGCAYCNPDSFAALDRRPDLSIREQTAFGVEKMKKSYGAKKFLAYFQNYTNTYDTPEKLNQLYQEALEHPDIIGLTIGTRPDCLPEPVLQLLKKLHHQTHLWIELGLQSASDTVLKTINRGHSVDDFQQTALHLHSLGIRVCAHIILGLPGETFNTLADCASLLNRCKIQGIKIHQFQIVAGSQFEKQYKNGQLHCPTLEEFLQMSGYLLQRLSPSISIHRLFGIGNNGLVLAPEWNLRRVELAQIVDNYLEKNNIIQGQLCSSPL